MDGDDTDDVDVGIGEFEVDGVLSTTGVKEFLLCCNACTSSTGKMPVSCCSFNIAIACCC